MKFYSETTESNINGQILQKDDAEQSGVVINAEFILVSSRIIVCDSELGSFRVTYRAATLSSSIPLKFKSKLSNSGRDSGLTRQQASIMSYLHK